MSRHLVNGSLQRLLPVMVAVAVGFFSGAALGQSTSNSATSSLKMQNPEKQVGKRVVASEGSVVPELEDQEVTPEKKQPKSTSEGAALGNDGISGIASRASSPMLPATQSMRCNPGKSPDRFGECR
jgi:hypothetical protein